MKALIPLLLLFACSCPAKPAATPQGPPPPGSGSATTPTTPTTPEPTGPTQGSAADPTQGPGSAANPTQGSGSGSAEPTPTWSGGPGIGENCGANDACAKGLTCVAYYGIAGARGPQFKSCEIRCGAGTPACPAGHKCITIADGPGQVCRKP